MKVIDVDDGKRPGFLFPAGTKVNDINEWLHSHYYGYKFVIVMDETKEEYQSFDKIFVEFMDDLCQEIAEDRGEVVISKMEYQRLKEKSNER